MQTAERSKHASSQASCDKTSSQFDKYWNGEASRDKFFDDRTCGMDEPLSLDNIATMCQPVSRDSFRRVVQKELDCIGDWCVDGQFICKSMGTTIYKACYHGKFCPRTGNALHRSCRRCVPCAHDSPHAVLHPFRRS